MKKIIFLNPPISMEERYGKLALAGAIQPPLGLINLASVMREAGWGVQVLDSEALQIDIEITIDRIVSSKPNLLASTAVTLSIERAAEVAEAVKAVSPRIITIIGGVHLTSQPHETMQKYQSFDYGVVGEGERTILELAEALVGDRDASEVDGVISRSGNVLHYSGPRPYIKDLDTLPMPAWDLLPSISLYYSMYPQSVRQMPSISIVTSRGCTGHCIFCDNSVFKNLCRAYSAEYVMDMIHSLYGRFGIREIHFSDDNFLLFRKRLERLTELLLKGGLNLSWTCIGRADMMPCRDTLTLMRKAGCWQIAFGVESGCQDILDFEKKGITLEQIEGAVYLAKDCGLKTKGYLMVGHPGETPETIMKTIEFVNGLPLDDISVSYFTVFPGSPIWPEAPKYGRVINDFSRMSAFEPTFIPRGFTVATLRRYSSCMIRKFYLRPRIIFSYINRIRSFRQIYAFYKGGRAFFKHALSSSW